MTEPARKPWHRDDERFLAELRQGVAWQHFVAHYLRLRGLDVQLVDTYWRDSVATRRRVADVDLVVEGFAVEVKARRYRWSGPFDLPFDPMLVAPVAEFEAWQPTPWAHVHVSVPTGALVVVFDDSRRDWRQVTVHDRMRGLARPALAAPRRCWQTVDALVERVQR